MFKRLYGKRGSMMVEAMIMLPLFILGIVTLMSIIKLSWINDVMSHVMFDDARKLAVSGYLSDSSLSAAAGSALMTSDVSSALNEESTGVSTDVNVSRFRCGYVLSGHTNMVSVGLKCRINLGLPISFRDSIETENTVTFRLWCGDNTGTSAMGFDSMESSESGDRVYVFPYSGRKFHRRSCSFVTVYPECRTLTAALKRQYAPCSLCNSGDISEGSSVYCFAAAGVVYHRASCTAVTKYISEMDRQDAIAAGYTACSTCGG